MKRNGGIIHNRGIEYTLTFTPIQKRDYALSISLNASKNWNEGGHTDIDVNAASFLSGRSDIVLKEGYPLSSFCIGVKVNVYSIPLLWIIPPLRFMDVIPYS